MIDGLKIFLRDLLGPLYEYVYAAASGLLRFVQTGHMHYVFFATALVIAFAYYWRYVRATGGGAGFARWLLPREIYLHRSAVVDYQYYLVNSIILSKVYPVIFIGLPGVLLVSDGVRQVLTSAFGPAGVSGPPSVWAGIAFTVAMTLAFDFAKWYAHFLEHRVPVLWEFHKVHHSAEVLTPFTNSRSHPVDQILEQLMVAFVSAPVTGVFAWLYPAQVTEITLWNLGILHLAFFLTQHLRHSHVRLGFGRWASRIFSSPAMHQIHHSVEERHWDRNFALMFSLWDVLAGTNYIPASDEKYRLGLPGGEHRRFQSLGALYFAPFAAAARRVRRGDAVARGGEPPLPVNEPGSPPKPKRPAS
ncbi:MAG: sterol desaturase family protein [Gammaproteobacteria bacterium]